jgi:hypothetical protein
LSTLYRSILNAQGSSFENLYSFEFDGQTDYISVDDADNLSFGNGTTDSPFSISAWIKMDRINRFRIISKYQAPNYEYQFDVGSTNKLELYIFDGTNYRGRLFSTDLNTGQWYHVTATYSGVGGTNAQNGIKLYVDGVRVDDTTDTNGTYVAMHNTSANVHIGQLASTYTNGKIDEVAIFNSELSASDVTNIYNGGIPNNLNDLSTPPLSWWRMGEAATWTGRNWDLIDQGSGGNNGFSDTLPAPPAQPSTDVPI